MREYLVSDPPPKLFFAKLKQDEVTRSGISFKDEFYPSSMVFVGLFEERCFVVPRIGHESLTLLEMELKETKFPEKKGLDWKSTQKSLSAFGMQFGLPNAVRAVEPCTPGKFALESQEPLDIGVQLSSP